MMPEEQIHPMTTVQHEDGSLSHYGANGQLLETSEEVNLGFKQQAQAVHNAMLEAGVAYDEDGNLVSVGQAEPDSSVPDPEVIVTEEEQPRDENGELIPAPEDGPIVHSPSPTEVFGQTEAPKEVVAE